MKRYQFNKLIRHKLRDRMLSEGVRVNSVKLTKEEYLNQLKKKLLEEAQEVSNASSVENLTTELADVLEVIQAIADASSIDLQDVEQAKLDKREINGYFHSDHYVNYIEVDDDNQKVIDYLNNKNRHYKFEEIS